MNGLLVKCYFLGAGFFLGVFLAGRLRPPLPPPGSPEPVPGFISNSMVDGKVMLVSPFEFYVSCRHLGPNIWASCLLYI